MVLAFIYLFVYFLIYHSYCEIQGLAEHRLISPWLARPMDRKNSPGWLKG